MYTLACMHTHCMSPLTLLKDGGSCGLCDIEAIMVKSFAPSTRTELQGCQARQKAGKHLEEHEEYALNLKSWTVGTNEKLAVSIAESAG